MTDLLVVEGLEAFYGQSQVLFGVSFTIGKGEVLSLLGRNGAGKTTTLKSIMGLVPPRAGRVRFGSTDITGRPAHRIARLRIGYVPEDRVIFPDLTVWENLDVARRPPLPDGREAWTEERVFELFAQLRPMARRLGGTLSGGEQQMLAIARALMGNPDLLLLDEPSEGLAPLVVQTMLEQLLRLKETGLTILLSEQNLTFARRLSDRVCVIVKGEIKYAGSMEELVANETLRRAYLTV
ncbi:MAG: ABC transporter ATP-binding protein [candidate division NC10 bacterium]|nr:ABC transporter ATP-binding protein [Candidatus Rokubacteria bacterium]MBI2560847.1 ABC transporter ATP-binding protein [candidate division NC10 bacterium]